jgi:hypothetical protein
MSPQHIDDLPRHEEPWLAVVLVLFVVLVWVTAPTVGSGQNASGEPKSDYAHNVGRASY